MSIVQSLAAAIAGAIGLLVAPIVAADPPQTIDFQGQLTTAQGQPIEQSVNVTFAIYDQPSGGSALWSETQAVTPAVGRFSVRLGSVQPIALAFDVPYYVGVTVAGESEMAPRFPLTASPYVRFSPRSVCMPGNLRACYTGPAGTLGIGACRAGQRACSGGLFGACDGQVQPASESCNGLDDNCDGQVDNGATCAILANATRTCVAGACAFQGCVAGFGNCDTNTANGCESNLATDVANCNSCGNNCATRPNVASAACTAGVCQIVSCSTSFRNCNSSTADGCETNINTSTANCGTCGNNCATRPNVATAACSGGQCQILSCTTGFGHCNSSTADGCETNLRTLSNCGSCGVPCALANASADCSAGTCQLASCNSGWANADGNPANGCETNLNANPVCPGGTAIAGSVRGDAGADSFQVSDRGERWFRFRMTESDSSFFGVYLSASVTLSVPAGMDYDLYVYCETCGGPLRSSTLGGSATETVVLRQDDSFADDTVEYLVEVRFWSGNSAGTWTLSVVGNVSTTVSQLCP